MAHRSYEKIGGWLILFTIGLILFPIRAIIYLFAEVLPTFSEDTWARLTTAAGDLYHPIWAPMLIGELIGNVVLIACAGILIVCLFQRRRFVPRLAILFLALNLFFVGIDFYLARFLPIPAVRDISQGYFDLVRSSTAAFIWIPYFIFSKRVKATFTG
jgi:hypothetical protein